MKIIMEHAEVSLACASYAYDAEVVLEIPAEKGFDKVYVSAHVQDTTNYMVAKKSIFDDEIDEESIIEDYESFDNTKGSEYHKYFEIVNRMIDELY